MQMRRIAALLLGTATTLGAQQRTLTPGVARYVSVNAPVVALTHARLVDGTGAPARADQTVIISGAQHHGRRTLEQHAPFPRARRSSTSPGTRCSRDRSGCTSTPTSAA